MTNAIPILLYHSVPRQERDVGDQLSVACEQFAGHLDVIVDSRRVPLTVSQVAAGLRGERQLPERSVAITFDDGYDDTLDAVELLRERGLSASVYVTTGQVDAPGMIGRDHLRRLAEWPDTVELGAHSVTHPHLDELSECEIESQVSDSKRQLEHLLGRPVETFAYPYGSYDWRVVEAVKAAGFQSAVAVKNALSHLDDDPWAIARWTVRSTTGAQQIASVLDGSGAPYAWRHERLRTRGYRTARRLRRSLACRVGSLH
jgi:peptidoglycan/xylan/chitin deacetylase (PgdA/CDA1 family)